ncbi:TRAP transporter small permease [Paenibacillus albiflavus]|uniref:TRAP transporter small permease n=1 Tax=Paenibacillus albiflavus TaxID=2545760 RepID=UPI0014051FBA|nr:TRAP transporter small permease subunit [Paenibacillus albiflavus]
MNGRQRRRSILALVTGFIETILVWTGIIVGVALPLNILISVLYKYVLHSPIAWSNELSMYLFCWITFIGASLAVKRSDIRVVPYLFDRLRPTPQMIVSVFVQISIFVFAAVMSYFSFIWITSPSLMNTVTSLFFVKVWMFYTIIPFSMLSIAFFTVHRIAIYLQQWISVKRGGQVC